MNNPRESGFVQANGVEMYWEGRGSGGVPLVVVHGGYGVTTMFGDVLDQLALGRRVIAIELQAHGHTSDIDRPFSYESFGDDIAAFVAALDVGPVDLLGYSLGGGSSLRATIQHPTAIRRLVVVSAPFRRSGWFPDVLIGMDHMGRDLFEQLQHSPMYAAYTAVAADPAGFLALMDKTGGILRQPYDWTDDVRTMTTPTLYVLGDADSISPAHAAEFYALRGGGLRDAGWEGSLPTPNRLAILPGRTHYDIFSAPELVDVARAFLDG